MLKRYLQPPPGEADSVEAELGKLQPEADDYDGFNLLLIRLNRQDGGQWDQTEASILYNRPSPRIHTAAVEAGCHGLSNSAPNDPWPKVNKGKSRMERELADSLQAHESDDQLAERLIGLLR